MRPLEKWNSGVMELSDIFKSVSSRLSSRKKQRKYLDIKSNPPLRINGNTIIPKSCFCVR